MSERVLVHIEKILDITSIEGADRIETCKVLGWECVISKKDNFKIGDLVIYFEIDSILDINQKEFAFLEERRGRIKTQKLRKQISQGLVMPISLLPKKNYKEGQDVTDLIPGGVKHYDPEAPSNNQTVYKPKSRILKFLLRFAIMRKIILPFMRKPKGGYPTFVIKTDEERIQNLSWFKIIQNFRTKFFYVTEKLDGSSAGYFFKEQKVNLMKNTLFGVLSRNQWLKTEDQSIWWTIARKYDLENKMREYYNKSGKQLLIQGECVGPNVNGNKLKLTELDFYVFNIIDLGNTNFHYGLADMKIISQDLGLKMVPLIEHGFYLPEDPKTLIEMADGKSKVNSEVLREGIVIRHIQEGVKFSFKAISNKFLLKHEE